ncbi:hypothetical protein I302_107577 [Kwoniella bestiolae CBS 10118]
MSGEQPPPSTSTSTALPPLPPPTVTYEDLIHGEFKFNSNSNGNQDDDDGYEDDLRGWGNGGSGKKRKVPNMNMKRPATPDDLWNGNGNGHSQIAVDGDRDDIDGRHKYVDTSNSGNGGVPFIRKKMKLSPARRLIEWKKELFIKRKANFISLYIDAQNALAETEQQAQAQASKNNLNSNSKEPSTTPTPTPKPFSVSGKNDLSQRKSNLPDVSEFEKLLPALEDINLNAWTPDRQGWKNNQPLQPVKFRTAIRFRRKEWLKSRSMEIKRKGWFPEGSFEFELECKASSSLRAKAREQSALLKLANELRGLIITANKTSPVVTTTTTTTSSNNTNIKDDDKSPSKTRRKIAGHRDINTAPSSNVNVNGTTNSTEESQPMSQSQSKDSNETKTTANGGAGGKKKPKKKKRSVLANQSNPHHVDNYRPSRTVSPHGDPYEPYSSHLSLFNPPPMVFLATRTRHKSKPQTQNNELVVEDRDLNYNPDMRPNEDDYLCCFCEYDLYYSTEAIRKKAIRRRKKEIKRKEMIKNKAKNVAEGKKGSLRNDNDSEYDSQDEDEEEDDEDGFAEDSGEEDCHDDGHGRCACGRRVKKPKPDKDRDRDREDG